MMLPALDRSDYGEHKPVRRSSSLVGHRELAEISRQQNLIPDQGNRQLPAPWEQELLGMKLASSDFAGQGVWPGSTGPHPHKSSERPDLASSLLQIPLERSLTAALARLSPQADFQPDQTGTAIRSEFPDPSLSSDCPQDQSLELGLASRKSITSPFLAAAEKFYTTSPQLPSSDQQQLSSPEASPSPLFDLGDAADPSELAAEASAGEQESVLPPLGGEAAYNPDDRFSLDKDANFPGLEMRHCLVISPLLAPAADRFLTADSFKNEPGQTLFDCTDPTPNQSTDLDDVALKARLAPFLPYLLSPTGIRVRRQLSSQFSDFASWSKSRNPNHPAREPDPKAIASADAELGVIDEGGSAKASKSRSMAWERGCSFPSPAAESSRGQSCSGEFPHSINQCIIQLNLYSE